MVYPDINNLAKEHGVHPDFVNAVFELFLGADAHAARDVTAYSHSASFIDYALSTNLRGKKFCEDLPDISGSVRVLDIGCAYGGTIHAFAAAGHDTFGLEVDPRVAGLGALNLHTQGSAAKIAVGDILSYDFEGRTFDIISCTDVIEHVKRPRECLKKVFDLLAAGGIAYFETVNRWSCVNVGADIHMGHFGITLLDHHSASAAARQMSGWDDYQVSDFWDLEWYMGVGKSLGAQMFEIATSDASQIDDAIVRLFEKYRIWKRQPYLKLDEFLQQEIEAKFSQYCEKFFSARVYAVQSFHEQDFTQKWVCPVLRFAMKKPDNIIF